MGLLEKNISTYMLKLQTMINIFQEICIGIYKAIYFTWHFIEKDRADPEKV